MFVVNNTTWNLIFVNPRSEHLRTSKGAYTLGVTDDTLKTVFIADNLSEYMTNKVLCHEITHVYAFEFNYYMPIEVEEIVADFMSLYGRDIITLADDIMSNLIRRIA
jgi:hypothetical protein